MQFTSVTKLTWRLYLFIFRLICSDALARGIDISNVDVVISYEVPRHIKTYIHRVGRTARAGKKGTAITILTHDDKERFNVSILT